MDEEKVTQEIFRLREKVAELKILLERWMQKSDLSNLRPSVAEQLVIDTRNALYGDK